jgi:hypothetical protein
MAGFSVDGKEIVVRIIKYLLEGSVVALACYLIPSKKLSGEEVLTIALTSSAIFAILDLFSPSISSSARLGAGLGIGAGIIGGIPMAR